VISHPARTAARRDERMLTSRSAGTRDALEIVSVDLAYQTVSGPGEETIASALPMARLRETYRMTVQLATPVARYADRFHRLVGDEHHVASPLGAWLVLALAAPAATGETRDQLAGVLGVPIETAAETAAALLADPHPAVACAVAAWRRQLESEPLQRWLAGLPPQTEIGDIPSQDAADAWARDHTDGLIETFPLQMSPQTVLVLASALATKVSWEVPFELVPARQLGTSSWALTRALQSPARHEAAIATTSVGDVATHTATSTNGLAVTSVIAPPDVPPADVLAAAHEVALGSSATRSLFDLPLGNHPLWTVTERTAASHDTEQCTAVLPAWSAKSDHDLKSPGFGCKAAADALIALLPPGGYDFEAKQSAVARYSRIGFEAAAVTAVMVLTSAVAERRQRAATLRFGHPFAVVAVAQGHGAWDGLPVFSAWINQPEEPE
jgi:hypothetical protein